MAQLDPKLKDAYGRVVVAGMTALYSPQTREHLIEGFKGNQSIAQKVAMQIAGLMKMLDMKAGMKIPKQVVIPAAVTLMMDLFKFLHEAGVKYEQEDVSEASGLLVKILVDEYKVMQAQGGSAPAAQPAQPQPAAPAGMIGGV